MRVVVFPEWPEAILILMSDGESALSLPQLSVPFDRVAIAASLRTAGITPRVQEQAPGRWTTALSMARQAERAERFARQKEHEAAQAQIMTAASDDAEAERAELILEKHNVDDEIRQLKAKLGKARSTAATRGQYMAPHEYRRLEDRLAKRQERSLAIQVRLGELKKARKAANQVEHRARSELFEKAAHEVLGEEGCAEIWERVDSMELEMMENEKYDDVAQ